ncbi:MAG: beta-L-arabinofuranosidase domain-containing protein [Bacteroidota bacterium]
MRFSLSYLLLFSLFLLSCTSDEKEPRPLPYQAYTSLQAKSFQKLPLGSIQPQDWWKDQLTAQAAGLTGNLDEFWPDLMHSAWKGGEGEAWERGPYFLDGLIPLAYQLNNERLIQKVETWIEPILTSAQEDGWFGPASNEDRWPLAVACKALASYYEATQDERALMVLTGYFDWLATHPPDWPETEWRGVRAMEHAVTGYWLYEQTGDSLILETIRSIQMNSPDWTSFFERFPWDTQALEQGDIPHLWDAQGKTAHVVNLAMAVKYPTLWYQSSGSIRHREGLINALTQLDLHHGQVGGRFSGDEHLSGKSPTQGTELCSVVELMYSLEKGLEITGDLALADRLESLAYNSLPGTMTPDCWAHQYDQQANQVLVSDTNRNWSSNGSTSNLYGLMPNDPCCLANMHQGWPKLVEHAWMATPDGGLAAMVYGPNSVEAVVRGGQEVFIRQKTNYPFKGEIKFEVLPDQAQTFPLYFRIPAWADSTVIRSYGVEMMAMGGELVKLERRWHYRDVIEIQFPMKVRSERRHRESLAILRGPLYFSLRIGKEYNRVLIEEEHIQSIDHLGTTDWEILPTTAWNYALEVDPDSVAPESDVIFYGVSRLPFADVGEPVYLPGTQAYQSWGQAAPLELLLPARRVLDWQLVENSAGPVPLSPVSSSEPREMVTLVPYGCARLRITEFPWMYPSLSQ